MAGHLYLNCKRNGETFALICYYGRGETAFALNQTKSLIEYIYDHIENDYRYNVIRFTEKNGGALASGDNNRDYAQKLFPDKIFIEVLVIMAQSFLNLHLFILFFFK